MVRKEEQLQVVHPVPMVQLHQEVGGLRHGNEAAR